MEQQEIKTLKIIEAIEENHFQSQRELSKRLGISLGLVNSIVKKIIKKGVFKVSTIPKNRVKYMLTAKGLSEKLTLTHQYILHAVSYYIDIRKRIYSVIEVILNDGRKNIVIYGATELAEIIFMVLKDHNISLSGIVDNQKAGQKIFGVVIQDDNLLLDPIIDAVILAKINTDEGDSFLDNIQHINPEMVYSL